jgi:hypothetical protein
MSGPDTIAQALAPLHRRVLSHPVFAEVRTLPALRHFMRAHVFAVWDFMSLLKSLQRRLTGVGHPWMPPPHRRAARLINEIVLGEESDEVSAGVFLSHFELYLEAMAEVGADAGPVQALLEQVRAGTPVLQAARQVEQATPAVRGVHDFMATTFALCDGPLEVTAAAFLLGRERLVPPMFEALLAAAQDTACPRFRLYLERHVHLDGESHGPMATELLCLLCGEDPQAWDRATVAATRSLKARLALWDAVAASAIDPAATAADRSVAVPRRS